MFAGIGLQRPGLDLPHDGGDAGVGRRRIAAALALLDHQAVDHVDFAQAALSAGPAARCCGCGPARHGRRAYRTAFRPAGWSRPARPRVSPKIGSTGWPRSWPTRIASSPTSMIRSRMPGTFKRVDQRHADHGERPEAHGVDDELHPLRRQDVGLDLDLADRRQQRLHLGEAALGAAAERAQADPGLGRRRVAADQARREHLGGQFDDAADGALRRRRHRRSGPATMQFCMPINMPSGFRCGLISSQAQRVS